MRQAWILLRHVVRFALLFVAVLAIRLVDGRFFGEKQPYTLRGFRGQQNVGR